MRRIIFSFQTAIFVSLVLVIVGASAVSAATSTNFDINQERTGETEFDGSSTNYQFKAEIGAPGVGTSTSTNYVYFHGTYWFSTMTAPMVTIQYAVPELRSGAPETNDDTVFYLTVRTPSNGDDIIVYTMPVLATTTVGGTYATSITLSGISPGVYDMGFKGAAHLTRVLNDVTLTAGTTVLNFSQLDNNSTTRGTVVLDSGDVSGVGDAPNTLGDDVVNAVDLSIILSALDQDDVTGNAIRSNLNQDPAVNSVDLSMMLDNLDQEGDN